MLHVVVPAGIDDPGRPSGGNVYDRRLCQELAGLGWTVREHHVTGTWPRPAASDASRLEVLLEGLPERSLVLVDGLVGSAAECLVAAADRLRLVVLVHMPLADAIPGAQARARERAVLNAVDAVLTTSQWARRWLVDHHDLDPARVHIATPGVDRAPRARSSAAGRHLLCVGPVTGDKGYAVLVAALREVADLDWHCTCVGAVDLEPAFAAGLADLVDRDLAGRVEFSGALPPGRLAEVRSATDLMISASSRESFGMAVAEALACGIPVVATHVGGHREALGQAADGSLPGILVPAGDADQLAAALRRWLTEPAVRRHWRRAAGDRRITLAGWSSTARAVADVLSRVAGGPATGVRARVGER